MRKRILEPLDRTALRRLYIKETLGSGDIAEKLGVSRARVQYWLKAYGIPQRSRSEAAKLREARPEFAATRTKQLIEAQKKITPEGRRRQALAISGPREPWSAETRAKHAYRSDPEYRQRLSEAQKGAKAHNWKGGVTPELVAQLNTWEWRERRKECYERDGWLCQDCGCHCFNGRQAKADPKKRIQAHHIKARRDGGTDDLSNLVTLCSSCHQKREKLN